MADLPYARGAISQSGAGVGVGADYMAILSCSELGSAGVIRRTSKVQDTLDEFGRCEGVEFAAHLVEVTRLPYLFGKLETATAGAVGPADVSGVTGSAAVSFSGVPFDEETIWVKFPTGGIVGTAGIVLQVSRDGGRSYGGLFRLGTATSYVIPETGITMALSTGTIVADDVAKVQCSSPKWNAAGLAVAFDALKAFSTKPRIILVCGDCDDSDDVQAIIDEIAAFETDSERHSVVMCSLRDWYPTVAMQHTHGTAFRDGVYPTDIDLDAAGDTITRATGSWITDGFAVGQSVTVTSPLNTGVKGVISALTATVMTLPAAPGLTAEANLDGEDITITGVGPGDLDFAATTITRGTGSFVTDGFKVGQRITVTGSVSNNITAVLTTVSATVLTHDGAGAIEANVSGLAVTIAGEERKATWRAALEAIVGATPQTQKTSYKVLLAGGRARRKSPIYSHRKRRPASWPIAIRCMAHAIHKSPAHVAIGPLEGWDIFDAAGTLEEHDERSDGGLLANRIACLRTFNELAGPYVALPVTLDVDGMPLSRLPIVLVAQRAVAVAQRAYTQALNDDVLLNDDGTIQEGEARRIDRAVNTQLEIELLSVGPEGPSASSCVATMARDVDLNVVGQIVPWEVDLRCRGYLEKLSGTVRVGGG